MRSARFLLAALVGVLASSGAGVHAEPAGARAGGARARGLAAVEAEFRGVIRGVTSATVGCVPAGVSRHEAGFSSGVIVTSDGLVLSDGDAGMVSRMVRGREQRSWRNDVEIRLVGGTGGRRTYRARVIHRDRTVDTALLRITRPPARGLPFVPVGRSAGVRVGDFAFTVGTAFDEEGRAPPSVTAGLVASTEPLPAGAPGGRHEFLYVSAAVNQGVNGGPLLDLDGRLIGTVSTYVDPTPDAVHQFLGKAIPIDRLRATYAGVPAARSVFAAAAPGVRRETTGRALELVFSEAAHAAHRGVVSLVVDRRAEVSADAPLAQARKVPRYQGAVSGVVVDRQGLIVTSLYNLTNVGVLVEPLWDAPLGAGLVEGLRAIRGVTVHFPDGARASARVLGHDRRLGVALLRADLAAAGPGGTRYVPTPIQLAPSTSFEAGRFVLAVGNPFGARQRPDPLLTLGILSRLHPQDAPAAWRGHWQTDAAGLDTNCGGAAVDLEGRLLGVFSIWHPGRHGRNSGIAFVLPWADVLASLPALERGQGPARGFLGISFAPGRIARVGEVIAGTPAEAAGLRVGDVIERVDRKDVPTAAAVISVLGHRCEGERVVLAIDRGGVESEVDLVLGARPPDPR